MKDVTRNRLTTNQGLLISFVTNDVVVSETNDLEIRTHHYASETKRQLLLPDCMNFEELLHPSYSPDLYLGDFNLFLFLKKRNGARSRGMEGASGGGGGVVYRVVGSRARAKADCGQQTDRQPPHQRHDTTWKKYTDSPGVGAPPLPAVAPPSPSNSRKGERRTGHHSPQHKREKLSAAQQLGIAPHPQYSQNNSAQLSARSGGTQVQSPSGSSSRPSSVASGGNGSTCSSSGKGKTAQNFGYVKRPNGVQQVSSQSNGPPQHGHGGRTAQVSAVPRTKVKVSGGTQTCTQDLQIHKNGIGPKSFSLGGTAAAQLSASVRERLLGSQSLPKPGTHEFAALFHHHRVTPRGGLKISDGSLSDTQTYSEVKSDYGVPYAPWLRHSNTYSAASGRLSEGESLESLAAPHPAPAGRAHASPPAPPAHHRGSLTHNKLMHQRDAHTSRLNRSNSIRSTKSEKLYPSMLQRSSESDYEPYYCLPVQYGPGGPGLNYGVSEPPSPSPRSALSPTHQPGNVMHTPRHSHHYPKKNDDVITDGTVHGSTASLVSTASSLAAGAGADERHAHEVRKLRRELADAKEKVHTLTTQLTTNHSSTYRHMQWTVDGVDRLRSGCAFRETIGNVFVYSIHASALKVFESSAVFIPPRVPEKKGLDRRTDGRTDGQQSDPIRVPFFPFEGFVSLMEKETLIESFHCPSVRLPVNNLFLRDAWRNQVQVKTKYLVCAVEAAPDVREVDRFGAIETITNERGEHQRRQCPGIFCLCPALVLIRVARWPSIVFDVFLWSHEPQFLVQYQNGLRHSFYSVKCQLNRLKV
ncbi:Protein sickie [Eumeta japonica]|uniref:Protein sickie n=1 Tax=Eumeta variegata TaxID=151549 RepID=A0A4C1X357_EUMVA|nr:Protein sickie [Eumeta japonica]